MTQALWWWFLLLYVLGIGGLTKSVLQFRRERSRIEKQAGSFPPRLALVRGADGTGDSRVSRSRERRGLRDP